MRYRLDLAYHGRAFHGWQRQPGLRTVQGEIEKWLGLLLANEESITVIGAGRTDAGVHATGMVAHFDTAHAIEPQGVLERLRVALPNDLIVTALVKVADNFHSRHDAISRVYSYRIQLGHSPFERDRVWQIHGGFDVDAILTASRFILGRHDCSGFCRTLSQCDDNTCHVTHSRWTRDGSHLRYEIRADRFLHEMVRLLVGTYVAIARGRWQPERITEILATRDVRLCGNAAPPHGLTLESVVYPPTYLV